MASTSLPREVPKGARRKRGKHSIYMKNLITRTVQMPIQQVGGNIKENIQRRLEDELEGKCAKEGFVKAGTVALTTFSAGLVSGNDVIFSAAFECLVCRPVEGMRIRCIARNVTKAGIRAETEERNSPVVIFVARDHHHKSTDFSDIQEGDSLDVKVIGIRYELNDPFISIIAELAGKPLRMHQKKGKIRIGKAT